MYEWIKIWYIRQLFWEYDHITVLNERNLFPWHHTELKTFTDKSAHGMWLHDLAWLQSWIKYWTVITLLARQNDFQQIITVLDLIISAVQRSDWSNNCAWAEPIYQYARFKFCPWSRSDFLRIVLHLAFLSRRWLCEIQTGVKKKKKNISFNWEVNVLSWVCALWNIHTKKVLTYSYQVVLNEATINIVLISNPVDHVAGCYIWRLLLRWYREHLTFTHMPLAWILNTKQ